MKSLLFTSLLHRHHGDFFPLRIAEKLALKRSLWLCCLALTTLLFCSNAFAVSKKEVELGRKEHEKLLKFTHFYKDEALNAYVKRIGDALVANSETPDLEFHFFIIDSPDINAFALPGGYIYINRGLMSYLTSEAQLAAVLSHEIAHVTQRHGSRRRDQATLGNIAAFVASVALLNGNIGDAIRLENSARVSGFGREMELEADEYGADYLYKTGYDPNAIIEVLSTLKDHQDFSNRQVRDRGRQPATYHGVFSTHPRSDTRLRDVIAQAGTLPPGEAYIGREEYRTALKHMIFGDNDNSYRPPGYERYSSKGLGVTFTYPDSWARTLNGQTIRLSARKNTATLLIQVSNTEDGTAKNLLLSRHQVEKLNDITAIYEDNKPVDEAATAILNGESGNKRVAAIKLGAYTYFFESTNPDVLTKEADEAFLTIIKSFRQAEAVDFPPADVKQLYFRRLEPGETFAELAQDKRLGKYTEDQLRLINGYYPKGEPQPGTWIKMAR